MCLAGGYISSDDASATKDDVPERMPCANMETIRLLCAEAAYELRRMVQARSHRVEI
jgi:hypothetical protein